MKPFIWFGVSLVGCMPSVEPADQPQHASLNDSATQDDTGDSAIGDTQVVVSTISDNFSFGAIATVDMATLEVQDSLAATSGDTVVVTTGQRVVVLNRLNTDTVRIYEPNSWTAPTLEFALPDLSNPQDALVCDDRLWVTQHNRDRVTAHNLSDGLVVGAISLDAWTGTDGFAEASSMLPTDDGMLIALQQFDQLDGWAPEGGTILRAPCDGGSTQTLYEPGPSPTLIDHPTPGRFGVKTGTYGPLDGAVYLVDDQGLSMETLITESALGVDITAAAMTDSHLIYITMDSDWAYAVHCQSLETGGTATGLTTSSFLSDIRLDDRGRAWISARGGWADGAPDPSGLFVYDPESCTSLLSSDEPIQTTLNPYSIDFL